MKFTFQLSKKQIFVAKNQLFFRNNGAFKIVESSKFSDKG